MKVASRLAISVAALALSLGAAQAATITSSSVNGGLYTSGSIALPTGASISGASTAVNSSGSDYASPYNNATTPYYVVYGLGAATLSFGSEQRSLSFLWGTPDDYNTVSLYSGGTEVYSFSPSSGGVVPSNQTGSWYTIISGVEFDKAVFASRANSFEFGSISATPVPVPAAGLLLLSAMGGMAMLRRRRNDMTI